MIYRHQPPYWVKSWSPWELFAIKVSRNWPTTSRLMKVGISYLIGLEIFLQKPRRKRCETQKMHGERRSRRIYWSSVSWLYFFDLIGEISYAFIPYSINGVIAQFGPDVVNDLNQRIVDALRLCIKPQIASGYELSRIYISSVYDSHQMPSRHMQHKAVDISRIKGDEIVSGYPNNGAVKAIVDAIHMAFEGYASKRENYGPHLKRKHGSPWAVGGHNDHIHLSVD